MTEILAPPVECPSCGAEIALDPTQRSALDTLVAAEAELRVGALLGERDERAAREAASAVELATARLHAEHVAALAAKDAEVDRVRSAAEVEALRAGQAARDELAELRSALERSRLEADLEARSLKERYEAQLAEREEAIERLRDLRARLSTKMVGESLEQHCEAEFERVRAMAFAGDHVTFAKDSDASSGTKGDYVFREVDPDSGAEVCSIMFEMKNEADFGTSPKKRNADHLAKLDKDRREKGCSYAVLVSTLESGSELYDAGIVDVSHLHPRMFVVRPQFFLPILALIRSASHDGAAARAELEAARAADVDITRFEEDLEAFKDAFGKNRESADRHLEGSIDRIDKVIASLNAVRDSLVTARRQVRLAGDKAADLSLRRLARGKPGVQALLEG